jgi:hypothetical protein
MGSFLTKHPPAIAVLNAANLFRDPERQIDEDALGRAPSLLLTYPLDDAQQPKDEDQDQQTAKTDIHDKPPVLVLRVKRI